MFSLSRRSIVIALVIFAWCFPEVSRAADDQPRFQLIGTDSRPLTVTAAELKAMPRTTVEVTDRKGQSVKYNGVAMTHILAKAKVPQGNELRDHWLRGFISVEAKDDYRVVFALPELDPAFTDRTVLFADEQDGQPLGEEQGPFQIIVPSEKRHARWIKMVTRIRVLDSLWADESKPVIDPSTR